MWGFCLFERYCPLLIPKSFVTIGLIRPQSNTSTFLAMSFAITVERFRALKILSMYTQIEKCVGRGLLPVGAGLALALGLLIQQIYGLTWAIQQPFPQSQFEKVGARHDRWETKGTMSMWERGR